MRAALRTSVDRASGRSAARRRRWGWLALTLGVAFVGALLFSGVGDERLVVFIAVVGLLLLLDGLLRVGQARGWSSLLVWLAGIALLAGMFVAVRALGVGDTGEAVAAVAIAFWLFGGVLMWPLGYGYYGGWSGGDCGFGGDGGGGGDGGC